MTQKQNLFLLEIHARRCKAHTSCRLVLPAVGLLSRSTAPAFSETAVPAIKDAYFLLEDEKSFLNYLLAKSRGGGTSLADDGW